MVSPLLTLKFVCHWIAGNPHLAFSQVSTVAISVASSSRLNASSSPMSPCQLRSGTSRSEPIRLSDIGVGDVLVSWNRFSGRRVTTGSIGRPASRTFVSFPAKWPLG